MSEKEEIRQKEDEPEWGERDSELVVYEKRELKRKKKSSQADESQ